MLGRCFLLKGCFRFKVTVPIEVLFTLVSDFFFFFKYTSDMCSKAANCNTLPEDVSWLRTGSKILDSSVQTQSATLL